MTYPQRHVIDVTTDADGNATAYSESLTGTIRSIRYVKDGTNPYTDGVDFAITSEQTGDNVWSQSDVNATATVAPRQATHSTAGVAALYAGSGTAVLAPISIARDRLKFVLAQGGALKTGRFHVTLV